MMIGPRALAAIDDLKLALEQVNVLLRCGFERAEERAGSR